MTSTLAYLNTLDGPLLVGWSLVLGAVLLAVVATFAAWDRTPPRAAVTRATSSNRKSGRAVVRR